MAIIPQTSGVSGALLFFSAEALSGPQDTSPRPLNPTKIPGVKTRAHEG